MNSRWGNLLVMRARSVFRRKRVEHELKKELQFHLDQEIEEARARGLSADEARTAALRRIGGIAQIQEECRDMRRTNVFESITQDIRYAARMLVNSAGFTIVMVLTLALSIGATSATVSIVEGVLVRPLPYRDPGRLVRIFTRSRAW